MNNDSLSSIDQLILVRLLIPGKTGLTTNKVQKDIGIFLEHRLRGSGWSELFNKRWEYLTSRRLITEEKSGRSIRPQLSAEGFQISLDFLGLTSLPPGLVWSSLQEKYLIPRVFNLQHIDSETRKRISSVGGLRAIILRRHYDLPIAKVPTETQTLDALLWKELGVDTNKKFSLTAVKELLLSRVLDLDQPAAFSQLKEQVAAKAIQARRSDKTGLRLAVIRYWLDETTGHGTTQLPEELIHRDEIKIHDFVHEVIDTARQSSTGWFGREKIFISHAFRCYQERFPNRSISIATFKEHLIQAHRKNLLQLSRADLVEAMPQQDVAESETSYLNARYHFIRIPGVQS